MTTPTRIAATFAALKAQGHMAFMPFVTVGDPDVATSMALIRELASRGVDLIEVGFPYSDPIADGPVIQASYTRALSRGLQVNDIFSGIQQLTSGPDGGKIPPLVAMVSYAIVFRIGTAAFVEAAKTAGFSGLIIPDLPADEAGEVASEIRKAGLDAVQLVAPTTTPVREDRIAETGSGFVYCISIAGTTGEINYRKNSLANSSVCAAKRVCRLLSGSESASRNKSERCVAWPTESLWVRRSCDNSNACRTTQRPRFTCCVTLATSRRRWSPPRTPLAKVER